MANSFLIRLLIIAVYVIVVIRYISYACKDVIIRRRLKWGNSGKSKRK